MSGIDLRAAAGRLTPQQCDQDEPHLHEQPDQTSESNRQKTYLMNSSSAGSDMQVFDDPSIQNGPKLTNHKKQSIGGTQKPKDSEGTRLPPGLPLASAQSRGTEENKRWKSTRET